MRLIQVAKAVGLTGQELRHELAQVDYGVKPTDREIADNLAYGLIRVLARKLGREPNIEALNAVQTSEGTSDVESEATPVKTEEAAGEEGTVEHVASPSVTAPSRGADSLPVLRKLTLEDVPKAAVEREARTLRKPVDLPPAHRRPTRSAPGARRGRKVEAAPALAPVRRKEGPVELPPQLSVKEFAEKGGLPVTDVIQALMKNGVLATLNQTIDYDTAAIVAAELGVTVVRAQAVAQAEHLASRNLEQLLKDDTENLQVRPPIVVIMGHVDHGKTSILDAIRQTNVVASESGGITQHIGAYQITHDGKPITFLDTPGHQAFTAMRARGAQVTDIAVLVVSAEEGVKETTVEAINHAKDAEVPILVAINKMDRPNANPERVKGELAGHGLQPEDWGGTTPMVLCSAVTKQGISDLLDHILVLAEVAELKANPARPAICTVIESHLDSALGPLATVVVNTGTLEVGEVFVCGRTMGRVRAMMDAQGARRQVVSPSGAVRVSGFDAVPQVGDVFQIVASEREARALLDEIEQAAGGPQKRNFADLVTRLSEGKLAQLKVVLKADTQGSLEALEASLSQLATDKVTVKVIHGAVGAVSESDVIMAAASDGIVLAFRVTVPGAVERTAEVHGVRIRSYEVIYLLLDEVTGLLTGLLEPEETETVLGHLEVKGVFFQKKGEQIVGGRVTDGLAKRVTFRLQRAGAEVGTGRVTSLRRVDKDIKEAKEGTECGMRVESSVAVLEGDVMEFYLREFKKKED